MIDVYLLTARGWKWIARARAGAAFGFIRTIRDRGRKAGWYDHATHHGYFGDA